MIVPESTFEAAPAHPGPGYPTASLRYFVWLYSPPDQQRVVQSLLGLEREIAGTLRTVNEHQVVHVRLEWWRAECERFVNGTPIHPLMRALAESARTSNLPEVPRGLSGFVDVATWDLAAATFETRRELAAYCERWAGAMFEPIATLGGMAYENGLRAGVRGLGAAAREVEFLADLKRDAQAGRLRLPLDELERAGVEARLVAKPPWPDALATLLRERLVALRSELDVNLDVLRHAAQPSRLRGLFVWAGLARRLARRIERALPAPVSAGRADTLAEGWQAWRAARSAHS